MKKKLLSLVASVGLVFFVGGVPAYAQTSLFGGSTTSTSSSSSTCGTTQTHLIACDSGTQTGIGAISSLIKIAVTVLSVMIGTVAVGGLAYAAVIYASARDNQDQITQARTIIRNIILGLVLYVFTIVIVNWLIPGGIIGGDASTTTTTTTTTGTSTTSPTPTVSVSPTTTN